MTKSTQLGMMAGFLSMMLITVLYLSDPSLLVDGYERLTLLIFAGTVIYGISQARTTKLSANKVEDLLKQDSEKIEDESSDFAPFAELLRLGFRIYVIAFFIKFLFVYFLFNYYDTSLIEMVKDAYVKVFIEHKNPDETEAIFQQRLAAFKEGAFGPQLSDFLGIGIELIVGFVISFVTALFFRRDQPDY